MALDPYVPITTGLLTSTPLIAATYTTLRALVRLHTDRAMAKAMSSAVAAFEKTFNTSEISARSVLS
ncbi:MAG: hypothetical protein WCI10_03735 [Actinomycetota bacterium]